MFIDFDLDGWQINLKDLELILLYFLLMISIF